MVDRSKNRVGMNFEMILSWSKKEGFKGISDILHTIQGQKAFDRVIGIINRII